MTDRRAVLPPRGSVRALLSYQCAIDALGATADPSHTLRHRDQAELALVMAAADRTVEQLVTSFPFIRWSARLRGSALRPSDLRRLALRTTC